MPILQRRLYVRCGTSSIVATTYFASSILMNVRLPNKTLYGKHSSQVIKIDEGQIQQL